MTQVPDLMQALLDSMMENGAGKKQPEKRPSSSLQSLSQDQHTTHSEAPESPDN